MSDPFVACEVDGVPFTLKQEHQFDWLASYGKVFAVFDQQDSGNISFGVERDGQKYFVKYAGAVPIHFHRDPQEAITLLKEATSLYQELNHEHLVRLIDHDQVGQGYVAIFDWFDGETLHPHLSFPPPEKYTDPDSPFYRFRQLPLEKRLDVLEDIFSFHVHVEKMGYVAIDFYDGSLLYDFSQNQIKICDIDLYEKKPYINQMGRMWGSSRFMSPEEHQLGATIDSRTNVYNMAAMAFCLVGGERVRSLEKWEASEELYQIVKRAVEDHREERFETVEEFTREWQTARRIK